MHDLLFLAQSDTTLGFLCQDASKINSAKRRGAQKVLIEVDSLATLRTLSRIPQKHKNLIRRMKKTTFIYPKGQAFRVIRDKWHLRFLSSKRWLYSSSANPTKESYNLSFAQQKADVIIHDQRGFFEGKPSKIYKINSHSLKRIR